MTNVVLTKFVCTVNKETEDGNEVRLEAVTCGSKENDSFFNYTPYGLIDLGVVNPNAANSFKEGTEYYVTFSDMTNEATVEPDKEDMFLSRLKSEEYHLRINCEKLSIFMGSASFSKIDLDQQTLLRQQYEHMTNYLAVLVERLELLK